MKHKKGGHGERSYIYSTIHGTQGTAGPASAVIDLQISGGITQCRKVIIQKMKNTSGN